MYRAKMFARISVIICLGLSVSVAAQKAHKTSQAIKDSRTAGPPVLWGDRGDISSLDILEGPGGREHQPGENFNFLQEVMKGSSPKFDVEDEEGVRWRVKLGEEAQPETAATRLVWTMGYFTDEDYYVRDLHVEGMPRLKRGREFASADGTVHGARLKRHPKGQKTIGNWSWFKNPFVGTKELSGLKVLMALIDNWDLKEENNKIYREKDGKQRYVVSDLGASFGRTGRAHVRSKGNLPDYAEAKFIHDVKPDYVDFSFHSRPLLFAAANPRYYHERSHMQDIVKHIPREDVKWMAQKLAQLSREQIGDCFRAAGYSPEEVQGFTDVVLQRIAKLNAL